jgi:hypothetical protein
MRSCSLLAGWLLLFCPCGSTEEGGALTEFQKPGGKISSVQLSNYFYARHFQFHVGCWRVENCQLEKVATSMNC